MNKSASTNPESRPRLLLIPFHVLPAFAMFNESSVTRFFSSKVVLPHLQDRLAHVRSKRIKKRELNAEDDHEAKLGRYTEDGAERTRELVAITSIVIIISGYVLPSLACSGGAALDIVPAPGGALGGTWPRSVRGVCEGA